MKVPLANTILLLLNVSVAAFATRSNIGSTFLPSSTPKNMFPFLPRGGSSSESKLSASVESPSKVELSPANLDILSERGRKAVQSLIDNDVDGSQSHVYGEWPEAGTQDEDKQRLAEQVSVKFMSFVFLR